MKWCMLMLLRNAGGRTRHGFRNATRAVRLPIDGALQPIVALDVAPGAVGAALAAYGSRGRACAGSVVVKGRARGSHERNQDGLGAQVLRADQLAPLLLAHALTGLRIACRPHEWDFGDAYGEEGAMAIFGCGRGADGRTRGVGAFATSAELDRLAGTYARRRLIHDELRSAYLRAVPLLRPFVAQETPPALACAARVYAVGIDDFAMWDPDAATTFVGTAANRSFDLARTVLRPQFDLVKAARPRPLDVWGDATVRVALHVRRGDVMPVESSARGAGVFPASDFFRPRDPMAELISAHRRGRRLGAAPEGKVQSRRARRVLALPPGLPGEPRERDGARRRRLDRGPRGPARRRRRARRGRRVPRRPAAAAVFSCVLLVFVSSFFCRGAEPTEPMFETGPRRRHRRGTPSTRGLMTQQPRETCYHIARHRRDQTRQRCARRRATLLSNAHVDAIARDLDVMASATAIFFSPASSMALLGAALAPEDVHLFEVCFAASFCPF